MDDTQGKASDQNKPGAPELNGAAVPKPVSAPLVEDRVKGPIFRAEPTRPTEVAEPEPVAVDTSSVPFDDEDEDESPDGPPALDEHQARIEYLQSLRKSERKKKRGGAGKIALIVFLVLITLGGIGTSVYFMFHRSRAAGPQALKVNQPQQQANDQQDQTTDQPQPDETQSQTTAESKDYTSNTFKLSLKYPGDWTPLETADKLSFTSPIVQLTDANNQTTSGRIIVAVRQQQPKPAELSEGDPVAVLASEKMKYTKPSGGQRAETYFTYAQFVGTSIKGGLDAIYITGSFGYQYAQKIKLTDIASIKPLINVSFVSCADTACELANQKPLTVSSTAWKTDATIRPAVETMLQSITLN